MKTIDSMIKHVTGAAVALAAGTILAGSLAAEEILFWDDFSGAEVGQLPTEPPWGEVIEAFLDTVRVREDVSDYFGQGAANRYVEYVDNSGSTSWLAVHDMIEGEHEVITFSLTFFEPDAAGYHDPLIVFLYNGPAEVQFRADRLRIGDGGFGASGPDPEHRLYQLDTANRLDWVFNNGFDNYTYADGLRTLAPGTGDIWINGELVVRNHQFETQNARGPIRGFDLRTFSAHDQMMYIDEVKIIAGADPSLAIELPEVPEPLVEFQFEGDLTNTGTLGGEGTFIHPREATEGWVFENRPSIGVGLGGRPDSGLDNSQVGGMGLYGQHDEGTIREGVMIYNPGTGLHDLQSITITGWFYADEPWMNTSHIVSKPQSIHVFGGGTRLAFDAFLDAATNRRETSSATPWQQETHRWIFFAVTFDGTTDEGNVAFYRGYEEPNSFQLDITRSLGPIGPIRNVSAELAVGANFFGTQPFKGRVDNIRIFGSTEDDSGVLSHLQLEAVWALDLAEAFAPDPDPDATITIVNIGFQNGEFTIEFEAEAGASYVVEYKEDLRDAEWQWLQDVENTTEGTVIAPVSDTSPAADRRFYRVRLVE